MPHFTEQPNIYQVLSLVPPTWSIAVIAKFLTRSIRISMHTDRTMHIERGLARYGPFQRSHDIS